MHALPKECGADGVILSNHGGRQLDATIGPLERLAETAAIKGDMKVMIDSGIRRGTDVLKAMALGADYTFLGRSYLYAATIGGADAVVHASNILNTEIARDMALIGVNRLNELNPDYLINE